MITQKNSNKEKFLANFVTVADHYRAKFPSRLLLALAANPILKASFNRDHVDHIQFINTETVGLEGRIDYFLGTGGFQDFISHQLQIYSLLVNPPYKATPDAILNAQLEALEKTEIIEAIRGQYLGGIVNGETVPSFLKEIEETGVSLTQENRRVETFYALKVLCNLDKWMGVYFYFLFGKRLGSKTGKIVIFYREFSSLEQKLEIDFVNNKLAIPLVSKSAGSGFELESSIHELNLDKSGIDGHTRLILDCMNGDNSLASSVDLGVAIWKLVEPISDSWNADKFTPIPTYIAGGDIPKEAHALINKDNREWALS